MLSAIRTPRIAATLDQGTLISCERTLAAIASRAKLDDRFEGALQNGVEELLRSLFPAREFSSSTHLSHAQMFLKQLSRGKLADAANRVFWIAKKLNNTGICVEAAAAGVVAGWFMTVAIRRRGSGQVLRRATQLMGSYEAFLMNLYLTSDGERQPYYTKRAARGVPIGGDSIAVRPRVAHQVREHLQQLAASTCLAGLHLQVLIRSILPRSH